MDKVVRVKVGNSGELTAFGVVGEIYFEPPRVVPRESILPTVVSAIFSDGLGIGGQGHEFRVASDVGHAIDIPVLKVCSRTMRVRYRFSAPAATPTRGEETLEIPGGTEQL